MTFDAGRIRHDAVLMHYSRSSNGSAAPSNWKLSATGDTGLVWTPEASGGTSSTLVYNVKDYGAVGDGSTDDTTAITNTFDAADATGGGIIYFPPTANYYKITSRINRTGAYKYHLLGGGTRYGPARVHQATSNTGAFKFTPPAGTPFDDRVLAATVENLTISGVGSASSGNGLEFTNDGHVKDCFVYGFYNGIYISGSSFYSQVLHSTVTDCDNIGIYATGVNNLTIDGCRITGLFSPGGSPIGTLVTGIVITSGSAYRIVNCSIEYFTQYGISIDGTNAAVIEGNYFETQQSSSGFAHLWIGGTSHTYATWVTGNYFQGDGTSGFNAIKLGNAHEFHIHANRFGVNSAIGITNAASDTGFVWGNENNPAGTFTLPSDTITTPGQSFAAPALTLGTANAAGSASTGIRTDATILAFDATAPVTQALGDSAATGSATVAARRDHKHGMPALSSATPLIESGTGSVGTSVVSSREDHVHPAVAVPASSDHEHVRNVCFNGDASTTVFTLPVAPVDSTSVLAFVGGALTQDFTLSGALLDTVTFGSAPGSGTNNVVFDIEAAVA